MPIDFFDFLFYGRPRSQMWSGRPARPRKADPKKKATRKRQAKARATTRQRRK